MSLQITSTIKTNEGIELSNAYARVLVFNDFNGRILRTSISVFASKEAYEAMLLPLNLNIETGAGIEYDRETMTTDVLDLAHDKMIEVLASQNIVAIKSL